MKKTFILVVVILLFTVVVSSADHGQRGAKSKMDGDYAISMTVDKTSASPGDIVNISISVIGYGCISPAKISVVPSAEISDDRSMIRGLVDPAGSPFNKTGASYSLNTENMFGDVQGQEENASKVIFSELTLYPETVGKVLRFIDIEYAIKSDATPGDYKISSYLTFYNGSEWRVVSAMAPFKVLMPYEKPWFQWLALLIVALNLVVVVLFSPCVAGVVKYVRSQLM